ncbi:MAG: lasso peptide biosynthesis B2 protein [Nitrospira sp. BO4]|jgi:hypothetical protein|nr:lasso peptide biosynthesis B2 protein [Nitrospira sp. BO4]
MPARLEAVYRKLATLRRHELRLLMSSVGLLVALPVLQRVLSLPALVTLFGANTMPTRLPPLKPERLLFLIQRLLQQRIGLLRPNCMKQSLVLFHFFRQWGAPVTLHFGVAKRDEALEGHCWIELADQPFGEKGDPRRAFTTVYTFPMDNVHQRRRLRWIPRFRTEIPCNAKTVM